MAELLHAAEAAALELGVADGQHLVDEEHVKAFNAYSKIDLAVAPTLFLEFHGTPTGVAEQAALVQEIAEGFEAGIKLF